MRLVLSASGSGAFAALLPGAAGPTEATAAVAGLHAAVSEPLVVDPHELFLTLSLGGTAGAYVPAGSIVQTLDGLFKMVAEEEKQIRENPVARTTDLMKQVFGAVGK